MKYTIEITKHTSWTGLEEKRVQGKDLALICEKFGIDPEGLPKDYSNEKYVGISVPCARSSDDQVFKQSFDELDIPALVMLVNRQEEKEVEQK